MPRINTGMEYGASKSNFGLSVFKPGCVEERQWRRLHGTRGLRPRPNWGSLKRSSDPIAGFRGPTSRTGRVKEGMEREKRGGAIFSPNISLKSAPLKNNKKPMDCQDQLA